MPIAYEKQRGGQPVGDVVWVDEPQDYIGTGPLADQQRAHAAEVIARMDASKKWRRVEDWENDAILMVLGPDGATTADGTPYADAVSASMKDGATSASLETDEKTGQESVVAHYKDKPDVVHHLPPKKPTRADVRAWAREQGIDVNPMGQVPKALIEQYRQAHGG